MFIKFEILLFKIFDKNTFKMDLFLNSIIRYLSSYSNPDAY